MFLDANDIAKVIKEGSFLWHINNGRQELCFDTNRSHSPLIRIAIPLEQPVGWDCPSTGIPRDSVELLSWDEGIAALRYYDGMREKPLNKLQQTYVEALLAHDDILAAERRSRTAPDAANRLSISP